MGECEVGCILYYKSKPCSQLVRIVNKTHMDEIIAAIEEYRTDMEVVR